MIGKTSDREVVLNDYLTEYQKNLMKHLIHKRAPGIIENYIRKPLEETSEFDIDDAVRELDEPRNQTEAELKGYLFAVYDSRKPPPDDKHANPKLGEPLQILINELYGREPILFKEYFGKPRKKITIADVDNAIVIIKKVLKTNGYTKGTAILRGYLLAMQDAEIRANGPSKKGAVGATSKKTAPIGLIDTHLEGSGGDTELYDVSVDEREWSDEWLRAYKSDDKGTVLEAEPANRDLTADDEVHWRNLSDLKELQVEHFYSISNAIRKDPAKYLNLENGWFLNCKLAKLTVAVLDDIRSIDPDFDKRIDIPGYKAIRTAELYSNAERCLRTEKTGR